MQTPDHITRAAEVLAQEDGRVWEAITSEYRAEYARLARALDAAGLLATPEHDAEVAAKAWDEGYAVGEDNFIHSDYCGRRCQCQGLYGTTNPYLTKRTEPAP